MPAATRTLTCSALMVLGLSACASTVPVAQAPVETAVAVVAVAVQQPTAERDVHGAYRFDMSQGEKKMTADEFDAWMKANGIRVARGATAPAAADAEAETSSDTH